MEKKNTIMLGTRVSESTYEAVKTYLKKSDCINTSDLLRRALSEYLENRIHS